MFSTQLPLLLFHLCVTVITALIYFSSDLPQVYVLNIKDSQMDVKWKRTSPDMGSGYGSVVAAGDVTGDGWSELFVGAPLYAPKTTVQGVCISVILSLVWI